MKKDDHYRAPISSEEFESHISNYTDPQADSLTWLYELMLEEQWNYKEAGNRIKFDGSNLGKVFRAKYQGSLENVIHLIEEFRREWLETNGKTLPDFVETGDTEKIFFACEKSANNGEVAIVYGPLGEGKSYALEEWCNRNPKTSRYIRLRSGDSYGAFLQNIGRSLGLTSKTILGMKNAIFSKLKRLKIRAIIFDEYHLPFTTTTDKVALKCSEFIRDIRDIVKCGIVLCGTDVIPKLLTDSFWGKALEQLTDRGNTVVRLLKRKNSQGLGGFYAHYSLPKTPNKDAREIITLIVKKHSLRKLVFALRDSFRAACKLSQEHTWDHFVDAWCLTQDLNPATDEK